PGVSTPGKLTYSGTRPVGTAEPSRSPHGAHLRFRTNPLRVLHQTTPQSNFGGGTTAALGISWRHSPQKWLQSSHCGRNGKPCAHALVSARNDAACEGDAIDERSVVPLDERKIHGRLRVAGGIRRVYRRRIAEKRHDCIHSKTSRASSQA